MRKAEKYIYRLYLNGGRMFDISLSNYEVAKAIIQDEKNILKYVTFSFESDYNEVIDITIRTKDILAVEKCIKFKEVEN